MDLFTETADVLQRTNKREALLKTLVYSSKYKNISQLFALASECLKYQSALEEVLSHCGKELLEDEIINGDDTLAVVLLYEYLIGQHFRQYTFLRIRMANHKATIRAACNATLQKHGCKHLQEIALCDSSGETIPRYARVNMIKSSVDEAVTHLKNGGWIYKGQLKAESFQKEAKALGKSEFGLDPYLNDLLLFAPCTDLHKHALVTSGALILQDRASCVPAHVLNPPSGAVVLDCCAAPGNKSCHLASLMGDKGKIIALDRDKKRLVIMMSMLKNSGTNCVKLIHQDFLSLSPMSEDTANTQMILVDPSCSGSGMLRRELRSSRVDMKRLEILKRFQSKILKHALRFPRVQRVVYSTCSIHQKENEEVVEEVMKRVCKYFQFKPVFPEWLDSRGVESFPNHQNFLRLSPQKHLTQGFFIACFERIKSCQIIPNPTKSSNGVSMLALNDGGIKKHMVNRKRSRYEEVSESITSGMEGKETQSTGALDNDQPVKKKKKKKKKKQLGEEEAEISPSQSLSNTGEADTCIPLNEENETSRKKKKDKETSNETATSGISNITCDKIIEIVENEDEKQSSNDKKAE